LISCFFNTLAQNGTVHVILIQGKGSELSNNKAIKGSAQRKTITSKMALSLVDVAKAKEHFERLQTYWNTYHCPGNNYTYVGKYYGQ